MDEQQETQEIQATELDTSYQSDVLNILDSINNVQIVNMFLICVLIGLILGGALWKSLRP